MNEWDQRIREHRVWGAMQALGSAISDALNVEGLEPEALFGLERLRAILTFCGKRLAAAEPTITAVQPLEEIAIGLTEARDQLIPFVSDKDIGRINSANVDGDRALLAIYQVPGAYSPEELGALVSIATEYRAVVERALAATQISLSETNKSFNSLQAKLAEITTNIQVEQQKLTQVVTDQQGQFSTAQEARSKEFTEGLRVATLEINRLATEYQSQFSTGQDTRSKEFLDAQTLRQSGYAEIVKDYAKRLSDQDSEFTKQRMDFVQVSKDELDRLTSEYQEKAKAVLDLVQERQQDVEKVVGVIGNLGVTSGYLRAANQAQKGMWGWQAMTMIAMGFLSWAAYKTLALLEFKNGQMNWGAFAGRVLLLGSLAAIAAYSGFQADKLFVDEKRNRRLALELEAIGPYLAPLPVEDQNKFRVLIGEKSFGRDHEMDLHSHKSPVSILQLLKSKPVKDFLEVATELAKKGKIPD